MFKPFSNHLAIDSIGKIAKTLQRCMRDKYVGYVNEALVDLRQRLQFRNETGAVFESSWFHRVRNSVQIFQYVRGFKSVPTVLQKVNSKGPIPYNKNVSWLYDVVSIESVILIVKWPVSNKAGEVHVSSKSVNTVICRVDKVTLSPSHQSLGLKFIEGPCKNVLEHTVQRTSLDMGLCCLSKISFKFSNCTFHLLLQATSEHVIVLLNSTNMLPGQANYWCFFSHIWQGQNFVD